MKKQQIIILFFLILISCKTENEYQKQIQKQVENLNSEEDQKSFLNQIYNDSQGITLKITELEKNFFKNKNEVKFLKTKKDSLININRFRVTEYLNKFTYPTDTIFNENEKKAIYFAVFHDYKKDEQIKYLDVFNNLYKIEKLDTYSYLSFLNKIYYLSEGSFYKHDKRQSFEEMIDDIYPEVLKLK